MHSRPVAIPSAPCRLCAVAKDMEAKVHQLIEASAEAAARGDYVMALERAKEAGKKERQLVKYKDSNNMADSINMELTYCCVFNIAQAVCICGSGIPAHACARFGLRR
ncbi:MAG: hypothetical protein EOO65_05295 [Methanosarcinales archaeon]|nr:MAG: hypothetical protein EOO65_05295 [Methanosarcinales archaeon]